MFFALSSILLTIFQILYILLGLLLIGIILLQRGDSGGLGGAFGGGVGDSAFGAKGDVTFKKITAIIFVLFLVSSVLVGKAMGPEDSMSALEAPPTPPDVTQPVTPPAGTSEESSDKPESE